MATYSCEEVTQAPVADQFHIHRLLHSSYGIRQGVKGYSVEPPSPLFLKPRHCELDLFSCCANEVFDAMHIPSNSCQTSVCLNPPRKNSMQEKKLTSLIDYWCW
ncbi:hypothetical protein RB195_019248 [Necator americanus]|uniref:Uncharacterized protein n=1 Tax=Necator americanus TaxID=51031 RepID=A0ABR1CDB4_NECAM